MGRRSKLPPRSYLLALAALALGTQACGSATLKQPEPAPAQAQKGTPPPEEEQPYHVAPPPAYGNKVVLAHDQATTSNL